jgi:CDP-diacylglycerol--serine O-phosphatidyltransferase
MNYYDPALAKAKAQARMRRGMFLLPSLFTAVNIGAGYFAIKQTIEAVTRDANAANCLDWAAMAILFAIPFDALDGRIARMTNTCSEFGKELDSLADVITFGVAPSLLAFVWGFDFLRDTMNPELRHHLQQLGPFLCFLFLIGGASRLARFNISPDAQPRNPGRPGRKYFVGMPIPAAAGLLAATVHFFNGIPVQEWYVAVPWLVLVGLASFLMVSTWRFWSGKEINLARKLPFWVLPLVAIVFWICLRYSNAVLFAMALVYTFSGIWARAAYSWQRRRRRRPAGLPEPASSASTPEPDPFHTS